MIKSIDANAQWSNKAGQDSGEVARIHKTIINAMLLFCKCHIILT
jgi:hypothetical protein